MPMGRLGIRAAIAEQAGLWFVANDERLLDAQDSAALAAWLKTSPVHIEEFLGVSVIVRDLKRSRTAAEYSLWAILARARVVEDTSIQTLWPISARWFPAAAAAGTVAVLSLGSLLTWNVRSARRAAIPEGVTALHFETRHGEQLTQRLADHSVLHLNTDSAVDILYGKNERAITLTSGQAEFDVAHETNRAFRLYAGSAEVTDIGTKFDVRLEQDSTIVTVAEGRVAVGPTDSRQNRAPRLIELMAGQQIRVTGEHWPATPVAVDAERITSWLHRQIAFDHESLERVAAEYNRYASKPIEIATPALRNLQISGVFATGDPEAFIAFLRSLKGVRVEVTETRIRVWQD